MYGLLNGALKEFVVGKYGPEIWQAIGETAAVGITHFNKMDAYPDELTYSIVDAASAATGQSTDEFMNLFGEFWVFYTAQQGYGPLFEIAGDSLRDFLASLDALHVRVGRSFPKLRPPSFRFEDIDANTLRMHYHSSRRGLCPLVPGLLRGLSLRFKTQITVQEDACARRGADHCEFAVGFVPKSS
jgi:hypothetical protein